MVGVSEEVGGEIRKRLAIQGHTLDVDATVIEAEKKEAQWTYKKVKGYQPILGFLAETGVCLRHEFREGNVAAQSGALEFLRRCLSLRPKIRYLRSDSAFYQAAVMDESEERGIGFTITADQNAAVKEVINTISDWKVLFDRDGKETEREVGTAIHTLGKGKAVFRLVVERWSDPQLALFSPNGYCYHGIASNRDELSAEEVVWFHNQRGQAENMIKELKTGFGMEQMTSGDFAANALWFALGVLAYNLTQAQKLLFMDEGWRSKTIATLRWQLIETAGRLVRHVRRLVLRLATSLEKYRFFLEIRRFCAAFH